jgi:RES domain-containing protein
MEVFRLVRKRFGQELSGRGAAIFGARWNSVGVELVYTAANRALAMAEVAVHFTWGTLPPDYQMLTISIPDDTKIISVKLEELPEDWRKFPYPESTQKFGDRFVAEDRACVLQIPSVVVEGEVNYLLNPNHSDFDAIQITERVPFPFDPRIFH